MRQCDVCREKWFFAATGKKVVCSGRCRSAKYRQEALQADPEGYREEHRAKMREWRAILNGHQNLKRKKKPRR
jgi:hypothetical protein